MYFYEDILEEYNEMGLEMTWVMKDGNEIMLKDMEDSHIKNCLNMLKRNEPNEIRRGWIDIFEDVQIKRRCEKIEKIANEIKNKGNL